MAARGGARSQLQLHKNGVGKKFWKELKKLQRKMWLGFGWLRAVARCYNYSYSKMELWINFQMNFMSCGVQRSWGLDGCALWRNVTVSVTIQFSL